MWMMHDRKPASTRQVTLRLYWGRVVSALYLRRALRRQVDASIVWMTPNEDHSVDLVILQKLGMRSIPFRDIVFLHVFASLFLEEVGSRDNLYVVQRRDCIAVGASNSAQTDNSNS